ncbi:MAG: hypothetical protein ACHREM_28590 [Polyangiales bacterium]
MTKKLKSAKTPKAAPKIVDAPLAIASDGTVLIGIAWLDHTSKAIEAAQKLLDEGHVIFIGVAIRKSMRADLVAEIESGAAEVAGRLGGRVLRRRRRRRS